MPDAAALRPARRAQPRRCFRVRSHASAPPEAVWPLIAEAARWQEWSFLARSSLLRPGTPVPDGTGALRRFAVGPFGSREEVVAFSPPTHLGYAVGAGLPVRSYRADIVLRPEGGGTTIVSSVALEPLLPGTGRLLVLFTRQVVASRARACPLRRRLDLGVWLSS